MDSSQKNNLVVLIVGAGAAGLACALALCSKGIKPIIIEKRFERSNTEKATGVSLGTWRLLAPFGVSIPTNAIPMQYFDFYDNGQLIAKVPVPKVDSCPPAHLFPQVELERVMENALMSTGVIVKYGQTFVSLNDIGSHIDVTLKSKDNVTQNIKVDIVIGADGARSAIRDQLKIPFIGIQYPENWSVAEIETLEWDTSAQACLYLNNGGVGLFLSQPSHGVVQGILNAKGAATELQLKFPNSTLRYERNFNAAVKRVLSPRKGNVWLIGDAAHIQSPVGGQGLNLAIWDGVTLGNNLAHPKSSVEKLLIRKTRKTLLFTHFDYRMLSTKLALLQKARNCYWSFASKQPLIAKWFFKIIAGV